MGKYYKKNNKGYKEHSIYTYDNGSIICNYCGTSFDRFENFWYKVVKIDNQFYCVKKAIDLYDYKAIEPIILKYFDDEVNGSDQIFIKSVVRFLKNATGYGSDMIKVSFVKRAIDNSINLLFDRKTRNICRLQ